MACGCSGLNNGRGVATVGRIGKGMAYQWQPVLTWGLGVSAATLLVLLAVLFVRLEKMDIPG